MKFPLRLALIRKFFHALRHQGFMEAFRKTRQYLGIVLKGRGRSSFDGFGGAQPAEMRVNELYCASMWRTLAQADAFHVTKSPHVDRKNRKVALIADMNLPQCRKYRVEQIAEFWRAQGISCIYSHYEDIPRCVNVIQDATHLMEYRLQAGPLTSMYRYEARRLKLPILYDIDDPLFSISAYETYENMKALPPNLKAHFLSEAPKYLDMMGGADILSMSTPGLVEHASLYSPRPVFLRRNFADRVTLTAGKNALQSRMCHTNASGKFTVAFASGSQGHEVDFAILQDQMIAFLAGSSNRQLMILGHFEKTLLPPELREQVEIHPFTNYDVYLQNLVRANCAIMPLTNDIFNRCKSAVRVIDAAAVAVPSIVGTVSDMANMVIPDKTGLVVEDDASWGLALEAMASNPLHTHRLGEAARLNLERDWSGAPNKNIISPELLDWVRA